MAGKSPLDRFLITFKIKLHEPATEAQRKQLFGRLQKFAKKFKLTLPDSVMKLYSRGNGGQANDEGSQLEILSLDTALSYPPQFFESPFGYLPVVENHDSNPICVCCKPPLVGYVVCVSHEDSPRLLARSLDGFYSLAENHVRQANFFDTYDLSSEFDAAARKPGDANAAHELVKLAAIKKVQSCGDATDALRFACDLLSNQQIDEIVALLDANDAEVSAHVLARLQRVGGAKAKRAVDKLGGGYDGFVEKCAELLSGASVRFSIHAPYGKKQIRVDAPKLIWLNMDSYYDQRHRPDFDDFFVSRVQELLGRKTAKKK